MTKVKPLSLGVFSFIADQFFLIIRAGLPPTTTLSGTSFVTTAPEAIQFS